MPQWFSKNIGDPLLAADPLAKLEKLFQTEWAMAGHPEDMALFMRHESEGRLHCEVILYFSPATEAVARASDATPCAKPAREGLSLLSGDEQSWRALRLDETS